METSLVAELALAVISTKLALWKRFRGLVAVLLSVVDPAYWAKGSSGSGVGIGAMVASAQATQASQVDAETVAEDVIIDEALAEVMDETIAVEELLETEPLDGVIEDPAAELVESVGDEWVVDGWLADGSWPLGRGPASSISLAVAAAATAAASSGATAAAISARASADARVTAASLNEVRTVASSALRAVKAAASAKAFAAVVAGCL